MSAVRGSACPWCGTIFKYGTSYRKHLRTRHPSKPLLRREEGRLLDDERQPLEDEGESLADNSDLESLSDESVNEENEQQPSEVTTFPRAGEILGDVERPAEDESNRWAPFENQQDFDLAKWFVESGVSREHINGYFEKKLARQEVSYNSAYKLFMKIDGLTDGLGSGSWMTGQVDFQPPEDDMRPFGDSSAAEDESQRRSTTSTPFFYRDIVKAAAYLIRQPCFSDNMVYSPIIERNGEGQRMYNEIHTGEWWWETQVSSFPTFYVLRSSLQEKSPTGATIIPLLISSDETQLTNFSGDKKAWPIYLTIGNIDARTRNRPSMHANVLLALLPVPPKMSGDRKRDEALRRRSNRILREIIELLFDPLREASGEGVEMDCSDGFVRRCFPILCAWIADHKENMTLHNITGNLCPVCEADESTFGKYIMRPAPTRETWRYRDLYRRFKEGEAGAEEELKARGIKQTRGVLWNTPFVDPVQLPKPDILHVLYLGLFKHMMDWLMAFLKKHKRKDEFDTIWARIPSYPGFNAMNKPYSQVSQWQGKEMRNLVKVLLPALAASLRRPTAEQRPLFDKAIRCIRHLVDFTLMAQYRSHTMETLEFLERYLMGFHREKDVFLEFRGGKKLNREARILGSQLRREAQDGTDDEEEPPTAKKRRLEDAERLAIDSQVLEFTRDRSDFNFPKMHMLSHFRNHVIKYGNIPQFSTELGEASHKAIKVGYKRSNKVDASEQILTHIATAESFAMAELNHLKEQKKDAIRRPADDLRRLGSFTRGDIANTVGKIAEFCDIPDLSLLLTTYFRRISHNIDDIRLPEYPARHYRLLHVPVLNFQNETEKEIQMIRTSGTKLWRSSKQPRNDSIWVWTGDERRYSSLQGRMPAILRSLIKIRTPGSDSESEKWSTFRIAIVELMTPERGGEIQEPHGLVIVRRTAERNLQCISIKDILGRVHLVPESVNSDNRWFVNSRIDLRSFNLVC